jgi:hypothetical protein
MRSFDCSSNLSGVAIFVYDPIGRLQTRLSNKFDPVAFGVMYIERFLTISTLNRAFYDLVTSRFYCRKCYIYGAEVGPRMLRKHIAR